MKINIEFENGNDYWKNKVQASALVAQSILSDPAFLNRILDQAQFDFTDKTPAQVDEVISTAGDVKINVGFYSKLFTRAIAYEEDGSVYFNTRKESYGAGSPGNIAHEVMHALGFSHNGNSPKGNENTVPWWVGNQVDQWIADGKA